MQETILGSKKDAYHYESFINDIHARDAKYNLFDNIDVQLEKWFIL